MRGKKFLGMVTGALMISLMCVPAMAGAQPKSIAYSFCMKDKKVILTNYPETNDAVASAKDNYHWICYHTPAVADEVQVVSSNPDVVEIKKVTTGIDRDIRIRVKNSGKATITVNAFHNGKKYVEKNQVTVKPYKDPFASIEFGDKKISDSDKQASGIYLVKKNKNKVKINCIPNSDWELQGIRTKTVYQKKHSVAARLGTVENGGYINLKDKQETTVYLDFISKVDGSLECILIKCGSLSI